MIHCLGEIEILTISNIGNLFSLAIPLSVNVSRSDGFLIWSNVFF